MDLWVNKYAPKKSSEILGNPSALKNLKTWLTSFSKNSKNKIALLIGPPGIGKTTCVNVIGKELGYSIIEYNASDARTEKTLREQLTDVTNNTTLDGFFKPQKKKKEPPSKKRKVSNHLNQKTIILMDEADGMTDGGISEVIRLSKKSSKPIVCICNFETKSIGKLKYISLVLKFYPIGMELIERRVKTIMKKEGFKKIDDGTLYEIIMNADYDMRQILTYLQNKRVVTDKLEDVDIKIEKDVSTDMIFNMFKSMVQKPDSLERKLKLYFQDVFFFPLFMQENYLKYCKNVNQASEISEWISLGDHVNAEIYTKQGFDLMNFGGLCSTVIPAKLLQSQYRNTRIDFPKWLGQHSKHDKGKRVTADIVAKIRLGGHYGQNDESLLDLFPMWVDIFLKELRTNGKDGVPNILESMKVYKLTKDDIDNMIELVGKDEDYKEIDKKVRAHFTRVYNKMVNPPKKKKKSTTKRTTKKQKTK